MAAELAEDVIGQLASAAWEARDRARVLGPTRVGCAALDETGRIHVGCNIEHRYRSHDVHAEVNAISSLVSAGGEAVLVVFIAAERERFTPCGSCLDWIFEIGGHQCAVLSQNRPGGLIQRYTADELMPFYPR
jgi:cytidine deaminase